MAGYISSASQYLSNECYSVVKTKCLEKGKLSLEKGDIGLPVAFGITFANTIAGPVTHLAKSVECAVRGILCLLGGVFLRPCELAVNTVAYKDSQIFRGMGADGVSNIQQIFSEVGKAFIAIFKGLKSGYDIYNSPEDYIQSKLIKESISSEESVDVGEDLSVESTLASGTPISATGEVADLNNPLGKSDINDDQGQGVVDNDLDGNTDEAFNSLTGNGDFLGN